MHLMLMYVATGNKLLFEVVLLTLVIFHISDIIQYLTFFKLPSSLTISLGVLSVLMLIILVVAQYPLLQICYGLFSMCCINWLFLFRLFPFFLSCRKNTFIHCSLCTYVSRIDSEKWHYWILGSPASFYKWMREKILLKILEEKGLKGIDVHLFGI